MSKKAEEDPRIGAIVIIAGCGVGAVALTLLFGRAFGFILPALAILGTAYALGTVWRSGVAAERKSSEVEALEAKLKELEQRLESAEAVEAFEERLAEKEAKLRISGADGGD